MIEFRAITQENFEAVLSLCRPEGEGFVASNTYSLAQAWLYRKENDVYPFAICQEQKPVGFMLLDEDAEKRELRIWRIMVDQAQEGKGYGTQAVEEIIRLAEKSGKYDCILLDCAKENVVARHIYEKLGFRPSGNLNHGSEELKLPLRQSVDALTQRAGWGDAEAQYQLAMRYIYGDGVEEDNKKAADLLEQSALQGHGEASYHLGVCYHYGHGVEADLRTAYELYLRSAWLGYGKGFSMVGEFYAEGICVRQNYPEAMKWFHSTRKSGDPAAMGYAEYWLGRCYENGWGVPADQETAKNWYEEAVSHGETRARSALKALAEK